MLFKEIGLNRAENKWMAHFSDSLTITQYFTLKYYFVSDFNVIRCEKNPPFFDSVLQSL